MTNRLFYENLYQFEIDRKSGFDNSMSFLTGMAFVLGGANFTLASQVEQSLVLIKILVFLLCTASTLISAIGCIYVWQVCINRDYLLCGNAAAIKAYHQDLIERLEGVENSDELVDLKIEEMYIASATHNADVNDERGQLAWKARACLLLAFPPMTLSALIWVGSQMMM